MSKAPVAISAFNEISFTQIDSDELRVLDLGIRSHINLRGNSEHGDFTKAIEQTLGLPLPKQANTFTQNDSSELLWLGPNEWLLVSQEGAAELVASLRKAFEGMFTSVNDVSGGNALLEVSGAQARALLIKGCPMDLHPRELSVGDCAQTLLGKAGMTLWQVGEAPVFNVMVRRSFADYVGHWILDAAQEFLD